MSTTPYVSPEDTPTVQVSTASQHVQLTPGTILGDRYRIISLVGRGGMGAVYRADDLRLGQTIALKFLTHGVKYTHLLYEEVRIGRQISHPNICRLYDVTEVDGRIFISMELIDGEDLGSLLRRVGRLTTAKAMGVARDLCAGLAAAHDLGVIHRDLKPGNVMIDGRGRARITDFGLAVAEESADGAVLAGTPAYMAPEQFDHERPSTRSDIYALGLVMYEAFTGRRAIEDGSLTQIVEQHRNARYARPSEYARGIDPAIERMILSCLDTDPAERPHSVAAMIRELPGFDPLAAAVAAGETPTPAMLAASLQRGDLRPRVAWTMFGAALAALLTVAALASRTTLLGTAAPKPFDVLRERTTEVLQAAGASVPDVDRASLLFPEAGVFILDRRSPAPMMPLGLQRLLDANDPPFDLPGMTRVKLDGKGHLLELAIVPPQHAGALMRSGIPAERLLPFIGIDPASLRPATPAWTAPVDTDEKHAWLTRDGRRIEAASFRGRPVWLSVLAPVPPVPPAAAIALRAFMFVLILVPIATLFMAWNHYRRRTGDRKGALRIGAFVFVLTLPALFMRAHHPGAIVPEWIMTLTITAYAAFIAAMLGVFYFAIEPYVRRRWPDMLISWSRVLGGQWRDPMVGRDLLIGCIAGAAIVMAGELIMLASGRGVLDSATTPLSSLWQWISYLLRTFGETILRTLLATALLLVVRVVVRRADVAMTICILVIAATFADEVLGPAVLVMAYALVVAATSYAVLWRFGALALAASTFAMLALRRLPLTFDASSWYFGRSLFVLALIGATAAYGFWRAAGGRRVLRSLESFHA